MFITHNEIDYFEVHPETIVISAEQVKAIIAAAKGDGFTNPKITAIKLLRSHYKIGLKDAKEIIESLLQGEINEHPN